MSDHRTIISEKLFGKHLIDFLQFTNEALYFNNLYMLNELALNSGCPCSIKSIPHRIRDEKGLIF